MPGQKQPLRFSRKKAVEARRCFRRRLQFSGRSNTSGIRDFASKAAPLPNQDASRHREDNSGVRLPCDLSEAGRAGTRLLRVVFSHFRSR